MSGVCGAGLGRAHACDTGWGGREKPRGSSSLLVTPGACVALSGDVLACRPLDTCLAFGAWGPDGAQWLGNISGAGVVLL